MSSGAGDFDDDVIGQPSPPRSHSSFSTGSIERELQLEQPKSGSSEFEMVDGVETDDRTLAASAADNRVFDDDDESDQIQTVLPSAEHLFEMAGLHNSDLQVILNSTATSEKESSIAKEVWQMAVCSGFMAAEVQLQYVVNLVYTALEWQAVVYERMQQPERDFFKFVCGDAFLKPLRSRLTVLDLAEQLARASPAHYGSLLQSSSLTPIRCTNPSDAEFVGPLNIHEKYVNAISTKRTKSNAATDLSYRTLLYRAAHRRRLDWQQDVHALLVLNPATFTLFLTHRPDAYDQYVRWATEAQQREEQEQQEQLAQPAVDADTTQGEEAVRERHVDRLRRRCNRQLGRHYQHYKDKPNPLKIALRSYQQELVLPIEQGIDVGSANVVVLHGQGHNTLMVAPTGSGKTIVAAYAIFMHFKESHTTPYGRQKRAVFVVPSIPLVNQQTAVLYAQLEKQRPQPLKVFGVAGGEMETAAVRTGQGDEAAPPETAVDALLANHVLVCTPQILINMLHAGGPEYSANWQDLSLLVLDECHHAIPGTNSPYTLLMKDYLMCEAEGAAMPQVLAMSASLPAPKKKPNVQEETLVFAACLACDHLSAVHSEQATQDLLDKVPDPSAHVRHVAETVEFRNLRLFKTIMEDCVPSVKDTLKEMITKLKKSGHIDRDRLTRLEKVSSEHKTVVKQLGSAAYQSWCEVVDREAALAINETPAAKMGSQFTVVVLFLHMYNRAIELLRYVWPMQVVAEMQARVRAIGQQWANVSSDSQTDTVFELCRNNFCNKILQDDTNGRMIRNEQARVQPPLLKELVSILQKQYAEKPDSKTQIFVQRIDVTQKLHAALVDVDCSVVKHVPQLDLHKIYHATGTGNAEAQGRQQQEHQLEQFGKPGGQILVCTPVGAEGLDVAAVNLVINYNQPNTAVMQTQKKGRARAKDGRMISLMLDRDLARKETAKQQLVEQQKQAVLKLHALGPQVLRTRLADRKRQQLRIYQQIDEKEEQEQIDSNQCYRLLCATCQAYITTSRHVFKLAHNASHVCTDLTLFTERRCSVNVEAAVAADSAYKPLEVGTVQCGGGAQHDCPRAWAVLQELTKWDGQLIPAIALKKDAFVLQRADDQGRVAPGAENEYRKPLGSNGKWKWKEVGRVFFRIEVMTPEQRSAYIQTYLRDIAIVDMDKQAALNEEANKAHKQISQREYEQAAVEKAKQHKQEQFAEASLDDQLPDVLQQTQ